jgi:hypothetical protein
LRRKNKSRYKNLHKKRITKKTPLMENPQLTTLALPAGATPTTPAALVTLEEYIPDEFFRKWKDAGLEFESLPLGRAGAVRISTIENVKGNTNREVVVEWLRKYEKKWGEVTPFPSGTIKQPEWFLKSKLIINPVELQNVRTPKSALSKVAEMLHAIRDIQARNVIFFNYILYSGAGTVEDEQCVDDMTLIPAAVTSNIYTFFQYSTLVYTKLIAKVLTIYNSSKRKIKEITDKGEWVRFNSLWGMAVQSWAEAVMKKAPAGWVKSITVNAEIAFGNFFKLQSKEQRDVWKDEFHTFFSSIILQEEGGIVNIRPLPGVYSVGPVEERGFEVERMVYWTQRKEMEDYLAGHKTERDKIPQSKVMEALSMYETYIYQGDELLTMQQEEEEPPMEQRELVEEPSMVQREPVVEQRLVTFQQPVATQEELC